MRLDERKWGIVAGFSGFMAIAMGAVGAHAVANAQVAALVETASLYQLIHSVALLWLSGARGKYVSAAPWLFLIGTVLFCGALYLKATTGWETVVRLAPFGGVSFMLGWLVIALEHCRSRGSTEA
jgi:uncharacterized membrane protein YgdD (TMEM256/DUF423 family)